MKKVCFCLVITCLLLYSCNDGDSRQPSATFVTFTGDLAKKNLVSDHKRVMKKELYDLNRAQVHYFADRPFYRIEPEDSPLYKPAVAGGGPVADLKGIWAYFYREEDAILIMPDGVIEQWEFPNERTAELALPKLREVGERVFFNTTPYFCQDKNNIYVFHSRSTRFSDEQRNIFEDFLKKTGSYVED